MNYSAHILGERLYTIARILQPLAQRAAGGIPIDIPLDDEAEPVAEDVVAFAHKVLAALDALPLRPRPAGRLNATDADALRLEIGAGTLFILSRDFASRPSGACSGAGVGGGVLAEDVAQACWDAIIACLRRSRTFPSPDPSPPQEPSP